MRGPVVDGSDIGTLVEAHYDTIFAIAMRMLGCRADAEDLAQDVCLKLAQANIAAFRGEAQVTSWLYRIVVNAARDAMRRAATRRAAGAAWGEVERASRRDRQRRPEDAVFLRQAMEALSETERLAVALFASGFTQAEVAEALDLAPGTVAWRMSEIRKRMAALAVPQEEAS